MAHQLKHHSSTEFTIEGHYCYKEGDQWISNPPIDTSDTNLMQSFRRAVKTCDGL